MSISIDDLVNGYASGVFPMAGRDGRIRWYRPDPRAILPLDGFHVPASLRRVVRSGRFAVTSDLSFEEVIRTCAEPAPFREETWISEEIIDAYVRLHEAGLAHSVETRDDAGALVGGLYGVTLGGAFFGESMFSRATDASKVALVHLVDRLQVGGFVLLDVQFQTGHLERFGAVELGRAGYETMLTAAIRAHGDWWAFDEGGGGGG